MNDIGPLNLTACDREPIHIPGSIQPHGLLLIGRIGTHEIVGAAGVSLFRATKGQKLEDYLGLSSVIDEAALDLGPAVLGTAVIDDILYDVHAFITDGHVVVELTQQADSPPMNSTFLANLESMSSGFERATSYADLFDSAARVFRRLTDYDRVLIYQFVDNEAGKVVGESRSDDMPSLMNHHFPASDIPRQARALYVRNRVRVIADVAGASLPIIGVDDAIRQIDLSDSTLRSVSPIHLTYLKNMSVAASASMSIVKDGILWGLVACHHSNPRPLPLTIRLACQALATSLSRQIKLREEAELYCERIHLRAQEDVVLGRLGSDVTLEQFFTESADDLAKMMRADGFAAVQGADLFVSGQCPDPIDIRAVADYVRAPAAIKAFRTACLGREMPAAEAFRDLASGLLAVTMSTEVPTILMWFRAERLQTVTWAGNPHKDVPLVPGAQLEPRVSFAAWSEEVQGCAPDWTIAETESAMRLVRSMLEARNNRRMRALNAELSTTLKENESLMQQKDFLLREVNHRVQNSLSLVSAFLRMQGRDALPEVKQQLDEADHRLKAVSLVHKRLYQADSTEIVDLSLYLAELCEELKAALSGNWANNISTRLAPVLIETDRAVSIGLILNELVINATKYAYQGEPGPISIGLEQHRDSFRLTVSDKGIGAAGVTKGTGFGSRMLASLVDGLKGSVDYADNSPGLRATVTAPIC